MQFQTCYSRLVVVSIRLLLFNVRIKFPPFYHFVWFSCTPARSPFSAKRRSISSCIPSMVLLWTGSFDYCITHVCILSGILFCIQCEHALDLWTSIVLCVWCTTYISIWMVWHSDNNWISIHGYFSPNRKIIFQIS